MMTDKDKKTTVASSANNPCANNGGHNKHIPTPETINLVKNLVKCGVQTRLVAANIGIDEKTLFKHYKEHMDKARANAHGAVGKSIFKRALDGDATAMKLYAKSQMGWKETDAVEHSGKDGNPIEHHHRVSAGDKLSSFLDNLAKKSGNDE